LSAPRGSRSTGLAQEADPVTDPIVFDLGHRRRIVDDTRRSQRCGQELGADGAEHGALWITGVLDDIGTPIGHDACGGRSGDPYTQLDDPHASERSVDRVRI